MDTKTIYFSLLVFGLVGLYAWLNPTALDYKFALLIVLSLLIISGFVGRDVITTFIKAKLGVSMPLDKPEEKPAEKTDKP